MSRDPKREAYLRDNGYEFIYQEDVPLKNIDFRNPTNNKARLGRQIEPWRVDQYARAWRRGVEFPAPVVYDSVAKKLYEPADGYHRLFSADAAGKQSIDLYIVEEPETQFARDCLFYALNTQEGQTTSIDDRCLQAWQLNQDYPDIPLRVIAEKVEISESQFKAFREYAAARERIFKLGLSRSDGWARAYAKSIIVALGRLQNEVIFSAAFKAMENTAKRGGTDVTEWLQNLHHSSSEADALRLIDNFIEKYSARRRLQQKGQAPTTRRRASLDHLASLCDKITKKFIRPIGLGMSTMPELDQGDESIASAEAVLRARRNEIYARRMKIKEQQEWTRSSTGENPSESASRS